MRFIVMHKVSVPSALGWADRYAKIFGDNEVDVCELAPGDQR